MSSRRPTGQLIVLLVCTTALAAILLGVSPVDKPLVYIFVPVVLLWVSLQLLARILLGFIFTSPPKLYYVLASVGVTLFILLLLLSGIGQLTLRDVLLTIALAGVSAFYFYRSWS